MVKKKGKKTQKDQKGGNASLIDYNSGGVSLGNSAGFIPYVENIGGQIIWTINSIISATNVIGDLIGLPGDMATAWGPNVPSNLK